MLNTEFILTLLLSGGFVVLFFIVGMLRRDPFLNIANEDIAEHTKRLVQKVRRIEIKTNKITDHLFSGEYHSSFKGSGMAFAEVRKYSFGDDVRRIDWNVTARLNEPYVKVFEEERELTFFLLVDISKSSNYGSGNSSKREYMAELAATLAFAALKNNDKVGLLLFADEVKKFLPPQKGRKHVLHIIRDILETESSGSSSNMSGALRFFSDAIRKHAIAFVLSDFDVEDFTKELSYASSRHNLNAISVLDPSEKRPLKIGFNPVQAAEGSLRTWLDSSSKKVTKAISLSQARKSEYLKKILARNKVGLLELENGEPFAGKMYRYFKSK